VNFWLSKFESKGCDVAPAGPVNQAKEKESGGTTRDAATQETTKAKRASSSTMDVYACHVEQPSRPAQAERREKIVPATRRDGARVGLPEGLLGSLFIAFSKCSSAEYINREIRCYKTHEKYCKHHITLDTSYSLRVWGGKTFILYPYLETTAYSQNLLHIV